MAKYKQKETIVDAVQYDGKDYFYIMGWTTHFSQRAEDWPTVTVTRKQGYTLISVYQEGNKSEASWIFELKPTDWIVYDGREGIFRPVKDEVFQRDYESIT